MTALIGYNGFVGSNLMRCENYQHTFNSKNICEMSGKYFPQIVCAGVSAVKWKANKNPEEDLSNILSLISVLKNSTIDKFVLISTIDVYDNPINVTESSFIGDHREAYGKHRHLLEEFVINSFPDHHIIRLPALYGPGLKKNAIYDLMNNNMVELIDPQARFQWYDVRRLHSDIKDIINSNIRLINISPEPIRMSEIAEKFFSNKLKNNVHNSNSTRYDVKTEYPSLFGGHGSYHFTKMQVLRGIEGFLEIGNEC